MHIAVTATEQVQARNLRRAGRPNGDRAVAHFAHSIGRSRGNGGAHMNTIGSSVIVQNSIKVS
jgi:hypothetical protein